MLELSLERWARRREWDLMDIRLFTWEIQVGWGGPHRR